MKKFLIAVLVILFFCGSSFAAKTYKGAKDLGIGVYFGGALSGGMNASLSIKSWFNRTNALQGDVNWDFNSGVLGVGVAYLIHNFEIIKVDRAKMPLYFGIKGWAAFHSSGLGAGVQVPLGIAWIPRNTPIDVFLQIEPGIMIIPATMFAGNGGLGIRFWF